MSNDDTSWRQRAFEATKATLELAEIELKVITSKVRQLTDDLQSVCDHKNIKETELKDYHDNGYGRWWSEFNYKCLDCGKSDRGRYNSILGRLYESGNKAPSCREIH